MFSSLSMCVTDCVQDNTVVDGFGIYFRGRSSSRQGRNNYILIIFDQWLRLLPPPKRLFASVFFSLLTGLLKTNDKILMKFYRMVRHNPGANRLDFG